MPKKIHTPFFRELSAGDTFCRQKQVCLCKMNSLQLEAPQSRLLDNRCIELKNTAYYADLHSRVMTLDNVLFKGSHIN